MRQDASLDRFTRTSERAANQVISAYTTSFGLATRLLGRRHRQHIRNIYALVRVADELVDGVTAEAGLTRDQQAAALERFVTETHSALAVGCSGDLVIHAFAQTARRTGIDETLTMPFFDSMRVDLEARTSPGALARFDAQEHADYVYGSAEVVGLMCLKVFLQDETPSSQTLQVLERGARQLGAAFQNINFLRDLADDTHRLGRSYLAPRDRLDDDDRLAWLATVRGQLREANAAIPLLPADARAAVRSAVALFTALADRIDHVDVDELYSRRVRVPDAVKAGLLTRAVAVTWRERLT